MPEVIAAMGTAFPEFPDLHVRAPNYAGLAMHFLQAEDFPLLTTPCYPGRHIYSAL